MANDFHVELYDRSFNEAAPTTLDLTVQRYSASAIGGYDQAEVSVAGPKSLLWEALRWLRYYAVIRNRNQTKVWAGFITGAVINTGGRQIGKSLEGMANRIAVAYSYDDITGQSSRGTTDWADDDDSQSRYGVKELLQSQSDIEAPQAEGQRDQALDMLSSPVSTIDITDGDIGGTLTLTGIWATLDWKLYNQPGGVERHDTSGNFEHILGWGMSSNVVGFEGSQDKLHDLYGRMKELRKDDWLVISGAANGGNNGTFAISQAASIVDETATTTYVNYTHATIGFDANDDITDNLSGLGFVGAYELLNVSGSASAGNNRYYFAKSDLAAGHITVSPTTVATSAASPSITVTIEQGHSVGLDAALTTEFPANTILVEALGKKIAQSFTLSVNLNFTVAEVYIRARVVGSPVDSLSVALYSNSSGSPGSALETVTVLGSTLSEEMNWRKFTFANTYTLAYGTTYWLVVSRTGSNTTDAFYMVDLDEEEGYTGGAIKLWDGSAWVARAWGTPAKSADMPFQVWGNQRTTGQISDILSSAGQFVDTIDVQADSLISSRQFRDQDQTARTELETLMKAGVAGGRRLLSSVSPERVVSVFEEPVYNSDISPLLTDTGELLDQSGGLWEQGRLPHGRWATLTGIPTNVDDFVGLSPVFIEHAEYDCTSGKISTLTPKGAENPWDVTKLA